MSPVVIICSKYINVIVHYSLCIPIHTIYLFAYYLTTLKSIYITFIISSYSQYTKIDVQFYIHMYTELIYEFEETHLQP